MSKKGIVISILCAGILLALAYGTGFFFGQVSVASNDLNFSSRLHLAVAEQIRTNNTPRALSLLETTLRHELWALGRWSRFTAGWQRHSMYDTVRRIASYYDKYIPEKLIISLDTSGVWPGIEAAYRLNTERSNADIQRIIMLARDQKEIRTFEAESADRNDQSLHKALQRVSEWEFQNQRQKIPGR